MCATAQRIGLRLEVSSRLGGREPDLAGGRVLGGREPDLAGGRVLGGREVLVASATVGFSATFATADGVATGEVGFSSLILVPPLQFLL